MRNLFPKAHVAPWRVKSDGWVKGTGKEMVPIGDVGFPSNPPRIPVSKHDTKWKACGTYAHLAVSGCQDSGDSNKRVAEVREMLQEKYNRQLSGNIYHAYRRMAHYTNATDPHQKCLYPRHLARFLGDLGVSVSESEACSLLCRERSAKSLRQPFGAATFHAAMLGKCPSSLAGSKT